jgi:hypothetical protein
VRYGRVAQLHIDASTRRFWVDRDGPARHHMVCTGRERARPRHGEQPQPSVL